MLSPSTPPRSDRRASRPRKGDARRDAPSDRLGGILARPDGWLELETLPSAMLEEHLSGEGDGGYLQTLLSSAQPGADVAVYHLARALPPGQQQRRLHAHLDEVLCTAAGERALSVLAAMVMCERRLPKLPGLWRQVGLCFAHDMLHETACEFALAVFFANELHDRWITRPAEGALHRRLLSAQLLASAAFGAVTRAKNDDHAALSLMSSPAQHALRQRLLYDREPLVWRLAALARGWLAAFYSQEAGHIEADLSPQLSATEWRRAGVSTVAAAAFRPEIVPARIEAMRKSGLFEADRGLAAVMLHGLWGAPDSDETRRIGVRLLDLAGSASAVELRFLLRQCPQSSLIRALAIEQLGRMERTGGDPPKQSADLLDEAKGLRCLLGAMELNASVTQSVRAAVRAYWQYGPERAYPEASRALAEADRLLDVLQATDTSSPRQVREALRALRDLQSGLLCEASLTHLLALGPTASRAMSGLSYFRERLTNLLLLGTENPLEGDVLVLQRERAVAAIRVLDRDDVPGASSLDEGARSRALQVLLQKLRDPAQRSLRRPLCAAAARAVDGLIRAGEWERADPLLLAAVELPDVECCRIMAEASMVPEVADSLAALGDCMTADQEDAAHTRQRLLRLVENLPGVAGPRLRALRAALTVLAAPATGNLEESIGRVEGALIDLERLTIGLGVRLTGRTRRARCDWRQRLTAVAAEHLAGEVGWATLHLESELGSAFPGPARSWLTRAVLSVFAGPAVDQRAASTPPLVRALPNWLPATRELGDYIILQSVGGGACGSVFLSRRRGQRLRRGAKTYALKVPELGLGTTRLSSERFLEMFRAEAGALASLPSHPNLAALESFDRSALPMPFLVMEYVEGPSLEKEIAAGRMSFERALAAVAGVARGLSVMHAHGIAHLDLKPSNVILRPDQGREHAVLVDFGLAGRRVRAGCGTHAFAAPEVFGGDVDRCNPCATDVYSFAVLAFEVLTSQPLFDAPNAIAYVAQHVSHDGDPPRLALLDGHPLLSGLRPLFQRMLRQDPTARCTIDDALRVLMALPPLESTAPACPASADQSTSSVAC